MGGWGIQGHALKPWFYAVGGNELAKYLDRVLFQRMSVTTEDDLSLPSCRFVN